MTENFTKVVRVGTTPAGRSMASLFCKVKFEDGKLSITGVIGPTPGGNARGGCGQIDMEFEHRDSAHNDSRYTSRVKPSEMKFAKGWSADLWLDFLAIWKVWHLNDMKPGCEHQRALGWEQDGYDKHPSEPCPTCGYKFGSSWLRVDVPADVLAKLKALPNADKQPAWV